ncbi:SpoIIE family protein phosphatase [Ruminococcus sp. NK3A76]|uniref:SpoIIE family protein phosphatase n=1 Tax=Ruminococcus sp. NK3A76 TaxID=877411 RepID=UPI00068FDBA5|nr:SpoIIE family protein phosphatase [Ruminococcus sp. NK3A76]
MKKLFGFKLGGLQQKILNLVLIFLIILTACGMLFSVFKSLRLSKTVSEAREEQQTAIEKTSAQTMYQVTESSLTKTNSLQSDAADALFGEIENNIKALRSHAQSLFEQRDTLAPAEYRLPEPTDDGKVLDHVLYEEGVDYTKSEYLPIAAHLKNTMISLVKTNPKITSAYIGLADGTHIGISNSGSSLFDENGKQKPYPVRQRPWYKGAIDRGDVYFTGVERDAFENTVCITCAAPVVVNNETVGVVGIDVELDTIDEYIRGSEASAGFIFIVGSNGKVLFAPENNGVFTVETTENAEDLRDSENTQLATFVALALMQDTGLKQIRIDGKEYYMAGSPMKTVGWTVISAVEKSIIDTPTQSMLNEYDEINVQSSEKYTKSTDNLRKQTLAVVALVLVVGAVAALFVANKIVKPIESMTDEIIIGGKTGKLFEMKDIYKTGDEIQVLAESFDDLSKKTAQYIEHITRITKEKERIGTELELARKIQADMLPSIYPAFPDRPEFDVYATMHPAKEVGGDFYDFFLIDDDHLGLVMADVSGKGVPAALFMMMSKILIGNFAMMGGSPAKVLEQTNNVICQNNEEEMFVTVWFGILEISTGKITAANAGHEYPILKKADGSFELFKDKHGFVIGGMDGMKYKEYEFTLEKGGALFLYTDGVPEATDASDEMFGTDRLLETLNRRKDEDINVVALLEDVKKSVDDFVGEADQFDDLTMLGLILT